jgi:multiple sugar transport system permease protein
MRKGRKLSLLIITIYLMFLYAPIYILFTMAFKKRIDIVSPQFVWIFMPTLDNFKWIFSLQQITEGIKNSLIVAAGSTVLSLATGSLAAYALSRFKFSGREALRNWTLTVRLLPPIAVVLPMYIIWQKLHLYDTYLSLIITYMAVTLPLVIWLLVGFISQIPREIEEAARIDGCGHFKTFIYVVIPSATPGIVVASILAFIFVWNDLFFAFVLSSTRNTFPVVINAMATTGLEVRWGEMAAMGTLSTLPALLFTLFARNLLMKGFQGLYTGMK